MTGTRARPWLPEQPAADETGDHLARLMQRRDEPGFLPTLRAAVEAHPRIARAYIITAALAVIAVLAMLGVKG